MKAVYRDVMNANEHSLRVSVFQDTEFPASWHFHPQYELTYIISSSGMRYIGDSIHNFREGDLVLVGANLPHSWKTVGAQTSQVQAVIIQWNENLLGDDWLQKPEFYAIKKMLELSSRGIKFPSATAVQMEERMMALAGLPPFEKLLRFLKLAINADSTVSVCFTGCSSVLSNEPLWNTAIVINRFDILYPKINLLETVSKEVIRIWFDCGIIQILRTRFLT